ncbi:MAG: ArnT family glycosyltransferase [Deltaproteobacteria bacterium]
MAGAILYIPFLGGVHLFDWDEINFAESAREMLVSGDYLSVQIDFRAFWEKPPLFIWMQVLSMKLFGINEFAARFPNAICGIITAIYLFRTGKYLVSQKFGLIWSIMHGISFLPFIYFKSGIIDPWFNLFIFAGLNCFFLFYKRENGQQQRKNLVLSAVFIGMAVLTKGPVGLLIFLLVAGIMILWNRLRFNMNLKQIASWLLVFIFIGGFWFILLILNGNYNIIGEFFTYQIRLFRTEDAGHGGFLLYHFVVILTGVFPAAILALPALLRKNNEMPQIRNYTAWMSVLLWVVLILFTIVKTKIVHYSSMAYFPISFLAAVTVYRIMEFRSGISIALRIVIVLIGTIWSLCFALFPFIEKFKYRIIESGLIKDDFATGNLSANVTWTGLEPFIAALFVISLVISMYLINNKAKKALSILFSSSAIFIISFMLIATPRIELYSQNAAIEFFKSKKAQDVHIRNIGYKSYAPLFYAEKSEENALVPVDTVLKGKIKKDAYFIFKNTSKNEVFKTYPELVLIRERNGFVFAKRAKNSN